MKRILIVSYEPYHSFIGLSTRVKGIANALANKGVVVHVAAPLYAKCGVAPISNENGVVVHSVSMPNLFKKNSIPIVTRVVFYIVLTFSMFCYFMRIREKYDVVQSEQIYPFWAALLLAHRYKAKLIIDDPTILSLLAENKTQNLGVLNDWIKGAVTWFEFCVYQRADYIICSSQKTHSHISQGGIALHKIVLMPNGVDAQMFNFRKRANLENRLFFNASLPFYQNAFALKNLLGMVRLFEKKGFTNYQITIIVNNKDLIEDTIVDEIGSNNRIRLLSGVESLVPHLHDADFVVLPYEKGHFLTAGARLKTLEAMSCGKVVVSTLEGVDGIIGCESGINLILCDNYSEMAERIIEFINNKEMYFESLNKVQNRARQLIEERYIWSALVSVYDKI